MNVHLPTQIAALQTKLCQHRRMRIYLQSMHPHDSKVNKIHVSYINERRHMSKYTSIAAFLCLQISNKKWQQVPTNICTWYNLCHASAAIRMMYNDVINIRHAIEKLDPLHTHVKLPHDWMALVK